MGAADLSKADFKALLSLADRRFRRWLREELLPERDSRIRSLRNRRLSFGGRAYHAQIIYEEVLGREVRRRIGFYAEVAHTSGNGEMLSTRRLGEFRDRAMVSVAHACAALKGHIEQDARSTGNVSEAQFQALLDEKLYEQLRARILDIVNDELGVLEAEGEVFSAEPKNSRANDHNLKSAPEIVKRDHIIRQNLDLSAAKLCGQFDLQNIEFPRDWAGEFGVKTWVAAYQNPQLRKRIDTMISKARRMAQAGRG